MKLPGTGVLVLASGKKRLLRSSEHDLGNGKKKFPGLVVMFRIVGRKCYLELVGTI